MHRYTFLPVVAATPFWSFVYGSGGTVPYLHKVRYVTLRPPAHDRPICKGLACLQGVKHLEMS